jgi:Lar family restriction alleviation protein
MTQTELPSLKGCPFCGSDQVQISDNERGLMFNVHCGKCRARGPWERCAGDAAHGWNTRTPSPETPVSDDAVGDAVAIFEMGFEWAMCLRGQTLEDSRAVGRTLFSDIFTPIADRLDTSDFNSFESADAGIVAAKAIIHAALTAPTPSGDVSSLIERVAAAIAYAIHEASPLLRGTLAKNLTHPEHCILARAAIAATNTEAAIVLKRYREALEQARGYVPIADGLVPDADIEATLAKIDAALKAGA